MGLADLLKTKKKASDYVPEKSVVSSICDFEKTDLIINLFKTPSESRDDNWKKSFLANVQTAGFACVYPQIFFGPDEFPYFILKTNEPHNPFESYCIRNMLDVIILDNGLGISINPTEGHAEWVFTYGDLLNLSINNEFFTAIETPVRSGKEIIEVDNGILIAQPSETFLPARAKEVIGNFLLKIGVRRPKIMMISRPVNGVMIQELIFNIFEEDFESKEQFDFQVNRLSWYLPKHYIVLTIPKTSNLKKHMKDLL